MLDALKTPEQVRAILESVDPALRQQVSHPRRYGWVPTEEEAFAGLRRFCTVLEDPCSAAFMISPNNGLTLKPDAKKYLREQALANSEAVLRHWRAEQILHEINQAVLNGGGREHVGFDYRPDEFNRRRDDKPPVALPARVAHLEYPLRRESSVFCLNFYALGWEENMRGLQLTEVSQTDHPVSVTIWQAAKELPHKWQDFLHVTGRDQEEVCFLEMGLFLMQQSGELFPKT